MIVMLTLYLSVWLFLLCGKGFRAFVIFVMDFGGKHLNSCEITLKIWVAIKTVVKRRNTQYFAL